MKKVIGFFIIVVLISFAFNTNLLAQVDMGISYDEIHARHDKPMPYQYVREADVMWSKIIWRRIELKEKMNHMLTLPKYPARNKMSLIDVILHGIHTQGLLAYKAKPADAGEEFEVIMTEEEVHTKMGASQEWVTIEGADSIFIDEAYKSFEIKSYMMKEIWYFDKQRSVLEVRIIGICPIRTYYRTEDIDELDPLYSKVFWIHYPEARPLLAMQPVYNPSTDVANLTYDDLFQKRYFSSWIFMESNPYRRSLAAYETGLNVLLESNRITKKIFDLEQDLWEY